MKNWAIVLIFLPLSLYAQPWQWATPIDGQEDESCTVLRALPDGGFLAGGGFEGSLAAGSFSASAVGGDDLYVARYDAQQELQWAFSAGSSQNDELTALAVAPGGDILLAGAFWFELPLLDTVLLSGSSARSLFIARLTPEGQLLWARVFPGEGLKKITGLSFRPDGSLALAGYFERSLGLPPLSLFSGAGEGDTFAFAAVLADNGDALWAEQAGLTGDTRALGLTVLPDGSLAIGGFFNRQTRIGSEQFTADTSDEDVFLARFSAGGAFLWAKEAGGVVDEQLTAMASDDAGNIYATGFMAGVMDLGSGINIQSPNGLPDLFLLKYDIDGTPLLGRALGGSRVQQGLDIAVHKGLVAISGAFTDEILIDELSLSGEQAATGFIAGFNGQGQGRWLVPVLADQLSVASRLDISSQGIVHVGGSYFQTAIFNEVELASEGNAGVFIGALSPILTPAQLEPAPALAVRISPNPVRGKAYLYPRGAAYDVRCYSQSGRLMGQWENTDAIQLSGFAPGWYLLDIREGGKRGLLPIIVE